MAKNYYDITLALAGICQSARLVQELAHQGHCDADALHVSLNSVVDLNPSSTLGVFGGSEANLRLGLETLLGVLNASSRQGLNAELTRYTLSMMVLERNDHPTNGLALCKNHHWAMDRDIIAPGPDLHWHVSKHLDPRRSNGEKELHELAGKSLLLPKDPAFHPQEEGLVWRRERLSA